MNAPVRRNANGRPEVQHRQTGSSRFGEVQERWSDEPPRRQPPRKRRPNGRFYALLAILVLALIVLAFVAVAALRPGNDPVKPVVGPTTATEAPVAPTDAADPAATENATAADNSHSESLAAMLGNSETTVTGLTADQMAVVEDLSVNPDLPEEWINVLFLGSDERILTESARTDSMMICSINTTTGEVKLTSIMRDLAVNYDEIGEYNGTYRINAANFFGGEELAMRIVNECFDMNIENYVRVNFYGFQQIAQQLGGVEMDITKEEMDEINYRIVEQAYAAYVNGIDESALPNQYLETYGENTHLDGRQTLAYARIRKLDGGDYARSERQRKVLVALMNKLSGADAATLLGVANAALPHIKTNLTPDTMLNIALKVLQSGLSDVESFRLPINSSYIQETRDGQDMLYDCDWAKNASELYYFIYE
jgi:LCP family protein required for cell wall assembly